MSNSKLEVIKDASSVKKIVKQRKSKYKKQPGDIIPFFMVINSGDIVQLKYLYGNDNAACCANVKETFKNWLDKQKLPYSSFTVKYEEKSIEKLVNLPAEYVVKTEELLHAIVDYVTPAEPEHTATTLDGEVAASSVERVTPSHQLRQHYDAPTINSSFKCISSGVDTNRRITANSKISITPKNDIEYSADGQTYSSPVQLQERTNNTNNYLNKLDNTRTSSTHADKPKWSSRSESIYGSPVDSFGESSPERSKNKPCTPPNKVQRKRRIGRAYKPKVSPIFKRDPKKVKVPLITPEILDDMRKKKDFLSDKVCRSTLLALMMQVYNINLGDHTSNNVDHRTFIQSIIHEYPIFHEVYGPSAYNELSQLFSSRKSSQKYDSVKRRRALVADKIGAIPLPALPLTPGCNTCIILHNTIVHFNASLLRSRVNNVHEGSSPPDDRPSLNTNHSTPYKEYLNSSNETTLFIDNSLHTNDSFNASVNSSFSSGNYGTPLSPDLSQSNIHIGQYSQSPAQSNSSRNDFVCNQLIPNQLIPFSGGCDFSPPQQHMSVLPNDDQLCAANEGGHMEIANAILSVDLDKCFQLKRVPSSASCSTMDYQTAAEGTSSTNDTYYTAVESHKQMGAHDIPSVKSFSDSVPSTLPLPSSASSASLYADNLQILDDVSLLTPLSNVASSATRSALELINDNYTNTATSQYSYDKTSRNGSVRGSSISGTTILTDGLVAGAVGSKSFAGEFVNAPLNSAIVGESPTTRNIATTVDKEAGKRRASSAATEQNSVGLINEEIDNCDTLSAASVMRSCARKNSDENKSDTGSSENKAPPAKKKNYGVMPKRLKVDKSKLKTNLSKKITILKTNNLRKSRKSDADSDNENVPTCSPILPIGPDKIRVAAMSKGKDKNVKTSARQALFDKFSNGQIIMAENRQSQNGTSSQEEDDYDSGSVKSNSSAFVKCGQGHKSKDADECRVRDLRQYDQSPWEHFLNLGTVREQMALLSEYNDLTRLAENMPELLCPQKFNENMSLAIHENIMEKFLLTHNDVTREQLIGTVIELQVYLDYSAKLEGQSLKATYNQVSKTKDFKLIEIMHENVRKLTEPCVQNYPQVHVYHNNDFLITSAILFVGTSAIAVEDPGLMTPYKILMFILKTYYVLRVKYPKINEIFHTLLELTIGTMTEKDIESKPNKAFLNFVNSIHANPRSTTFGRCQRAELL